MGTLAYLPHHCRKRSTVLAFWRQFCPQRAQGDGRGLRRFVKTLQDQSSYSSRLRTKAENRKSEQAEISTQFWHMAHKALQDLYYITLRISSKPWRWSIMTSRCLSRTAMATKSWNCVERWSEKRTSQRRMISTHSNSRLNQIKSQRKQKNKFKASHFSKRHKG